MATEDILYPTNQAMEMFKKREEREHQLNYLCSSKIFVSGRALGGHMRVHAPASMDAEKLAEIEFKRSKKPEDSQKHETQDKENDRSESDAEVVIDYPSGNSSKWMKGKRSKRSRYAPQFNPLDRFGSSANTEVEDIALCLVMFASGVNTAQNPQFQMGAEKPRSGDLKLPTAGSQIPKCIRKRPKYKKIDACVGLYNDDQVEKTRYKCNTCNKVFHSPQSLGGHRASHNKVKECFPPIEEEKGSQEEEISEEEHHIGSYSQLLGKFHKPPPKERTKYSGAKARDGTRTIEFAAILGKKTTRIHECSICKKGFVSGQALGGHKRCHWGTGASDTLTTSCGNKETPMLPDRVELLDLNLPAPFDDDCDAGDLNTLECNAVDSHGSSHAQTHNPPSLISSLMSNHPRQGLFLYNSDTDLSKDDEADSKVGKGIRFGRGSNSEFPVRAPSWLQL